MANRNIISAKHSFLLVLLIILTGAVFNVTYNLVGDQWSIEARVFFNSVFVDLGLTTLTPLLLLYSSMELRQTIKTIIRKKLCNT